MNRTSDPFHNLADAASEDVVAASATALAAEAAQERGDSGAFALDFDRIVVRAERQARWRRFAQRLRSVAAALGSRPSWRPVLATVAGLAVVVVTGDLLLQQRAGAPAVSSAPTSAEPSPKPVTDKLAEQRSVDEGRTGEAKHFAGAPAVLAPPPGPASDVANTPKPVHTVPIRGGVDAPNPPAARAAPPRLPRTDRDGALSLAEEDHSRAATVQRKTASQPAAPQVAAVPAAPPPAAAAQSSREAPSFVWPLRGDLIADFGAVTNGRHNDGIDIATPVGTDIHAADDGVVVYASDDIKGYGNLVLLRHSGGFVTAYAHTDKILVKLNDVVHRGQVIAKSGRTGDVPLLHFEIRKGSTPVDPTPFLPRG
jgi:murein DD-endopeptidase MepM/ murein hydrolase activator NlpD